MVFKIIIPVLLLLGLCFADESAPRERYLHISTNPSGADLYVGDVHPNFSKKPDYRIPAFITVSLDNNQILFYIFLPEFKYNCIEVYTAHNNQY